MSESSSSSSSDVRRVEELHLDPRNRRGHPTRNASMMRESLRAVGAARSIVIDEDDVVLAGNEPVMRGLNPSAALSSGLNFAVMRGFGRHCSEWLGLCPVGQVLPQAAPLWACTRLRRTTSGSSNGSAALTLSRNVCIAMRLEVVQTPLISRS